MSYSTVDIGSHPYYVYADISAADLYLDATITEAGTAWRASTTDADKKSRALVSSTRWLDAANYTGARTDPAQALAWPRTGVALVDPATVPDALTAASIELAALLVSDPDLRTNLQDPVKKELRAGSVILVNFRPRNVQVTTFFPANIMSLIGQWMQGPTAVGAIANDVCRESELRRPFDFDHGF